MSAESFKSKLDELSITLKTTYCECPNYGLIIPVLLEKGIAALPDHCKITPGLPMKPMLAQPTKGVQEVLTRFENLEFTCEWKYDGERAQVILLKKRRKFKIKKSQTMTMLTMYDDFRFIF